MCVSPAPENAQDATADACCRSDQDQRPGDNKHDNVGHEEKQDHYRRAKEQTGQSKKWAQIVSTVLRHAHSSVRRNQRHRAPHSPNLLQKVETVEIRVVITPGERPQAATEISVPA
jgi:hypothetical protein